MNKNWRWLLVLTITESVKVPSCMGSHWYFYLISRINISTLYRSFIIFLHTANTQKTNNVYKNYHSISSILENVTLHQYPHNKLTAVVSLISILVVLMNILNNNYLNGPSESVLSSRSRHPCSLVSILISRVPLFWDYGKSFKISQTSSTIVIQCIDNSRGWMINHNKWQNQTITCLTKQLHFFLTRNKFQPSSKQFTVANKNQDLKKSGLQCDLNKKTLSVWKWIN